MKTMKKAAEIIRVTNDTVNERLKDGWSFCPKKEWKQKVRDKDKKVEKKPVEKNTIDQGDHARPLHQKGERQVSKYRTKQAHN